MASSATRVTLVLADDHTMVREGIRGLIQSRLPEIEIVAEAATGRETLDLCKQFHPDVVLLDISMPELGGLEVLAQLRTASPKTRAAILSQYSDRAYVIRALQLGAKAYVLKKAMAKDLVAALQAVIAGRTYLDPAVAAYVVEAAVSPQPAESASEIAQLTEREIEVLKLTSEGRTAKEVAQLLGISEHTANRHRATLMDKLGVRSKVELVKIAIRAKLIVIDES